MTDAALRYAVLLEKQEHLQLPKISEALAAHYRIPLADTARLARACWGIAADDMEEADARALAVRLSGAGLIGIVLPRNLLEEPPAALEASRAEFDDEGMRLFPKTGDGASVLWPRLALVAAAAFKQVSVKSVKVQEGPSMGQKAASLGITMMTGIPVHIGGKKQEVDKLRETSELVFYLDLYERKPPRRVRVSAQDFNYACLGDKMQYGSAANFRALLERLAKSAPSAVLNRGARFLLESKPVNTMGYDSLADLERESRWLLTLAALRDP